MKKIILKALIFSVFPVSLIFAQTETPTQTQTQPQTQTQTQPQPPATQTAPGTQASAITSQPLRDALDAVAKSEGTGLTLAADPFMTSTGETFLAILLAPSAELTPTQAAIRLMDATGKVVTETEFSTAGQKPGQFQASIPVTPGKYTLAAAVVAAEKTASAKASLDVPVFAGKLSVSPIVTAKEYAQLTDAKPEKEPYTFGKLRLMPNVERVFTKTENLIVVYEIYNFSVDSTTSKPNLEVVAEFTNEQGKSTKTPAEAPQGLAIGKKMTVPVGYPMQDLPPGKYTLTLNVKDKISNATATSKASFTVK